MHFAADGAAVGTRLALRRQQAGAGPDLIEVFTDGKRVPYGNAFMAQAGHQPGRRQQPDFRARGRIVGGKPDLLERQAGQPWQTDPHGVYFFATPPPFPVWVRELLPIPEPLSERSPEPMPNLRWVDMPVALLHQLPVGSLYRTRFDGNTYRKTGSQRTKCDVFVVAWDDGTKPERPTVDGAR